MQERIHLCYCANKGYFPMILLSVLSVAKYTAAPVTVYLVTMDDTEADPRFLPFSEGQREIAERALRQSDPESRVLLLDMKEAYLRRLAGGKNAKSSYTPYAQLRLLLDESEVAEKLIYLDADVMCCSDLSQLWGGVPLNGHEFAAVLDHMGKFWINRRYCNSGVLLLNMKLIRESGFFARVTEYVRRHKMLMPDQTALNRLAANKLIIPRRFNEQRGIAEDTVLKHFCRGIKWLPFFKVYNYKQTDRKKVRETLGIRLFDDIYRLYDEIALSCDLTK